MHTLSKQALEILLKKPTDGAYVRTRRLSLRGFRVDHGNTVKLPKEYPTSYSPPPTAAPGKVITDDKDNNKDIS